MKSIEKTKKLVTNWAINNTLHHSNYNKGNLVSTNKTTSLVTSWAINNTLRHNDSITA